jgi:hydrogenase maturation protein HypF
MMPETPSSLCREIEVDPSDIVSWTLCLRGRVQGLGVRPSIAQRASSMGLTGYVQNTSNGVRIVLEGRLSAVSHFVDHLKDTMPRASEFRISELTRQRPSGTANFTIQESSDDGSVAAEVPVDLAMCSECSTELMDPFHRRFRDLFSSCTRCGPRYSIIHSMPFERTQTAMSAFAMCEECQREYSSCHDRRFHAQTVTCKNCGPRLRFQSANSSIQSAGEEAIRHAVAHIRRGLILALKGLGGYQLICDATNESAVSRLRQAKRRTTKPLAVMLDRELSAWPRLSRQLTDEEHRLLASPQNPIVLLDAMQCAALASNVDQRFNSLGVFLPTTPLHAILLRDLRRPLVVTSGNRGSEPLEYHAWADDDGLSPLADAWLQHDRDIVRPLDDSVVRPVAGTAVTIRAGRGIAPLVLKVSPGHSILAVGGEQKVACAISNGCQAVLGPHIGDMSSLACRRRFVEQIDAMKTLYRCRPNVVVHDLHPDYFTTRWAVEQNVRTIAVQHHHAHTAAAMVEHNLLHEKVLSVVFDGNGFGTDGTIWGGEFLLATATGFQRVASLLPFALPGGDAAVREPWRVAVSLLRAACPELTDKAIEELLNDSCGIEANRIPQIQALIKSQTCPVTTSMGRLFDGIACLILGSPVAEFEGEQAMRLESACLGKTQCLSALLRGEIPEETIGLLVSPTSETVHVDWRPIVRRIVNALRDSTSLQDAALEFHRFIAWQVAEVVRRFPGSPIVLSGGCFQNRILTEMVMDAVSRQGGLVFPPGRIPPNDGGLAAGQIAIAAAILDVEERERNVPCA